MKVTSLEPIELLLTADAGYALQVATVLNSAVKHSSRPLSVTVLGVDFDDTARAIVQSVAGLERVDIIDADVSLVSDLPLMWYYQPVAFIRMYADEIIERDIGKMLYLDADVLVRTDLAELWDVDLGDSILAAVQDWGCPWIGSPHGVPVWKELGLSGGAPYFNSGVLLFDLRRWKAEKFSRQLRQFVTDHRDQLKCVDQEALNVCSYGRWTILDPRWNCQILALSEPEPWYYGDIINTVEAQERAVHDPSIVHYTGSFKPWLRKASGWDKPYFEEWRSAAYPLGYRDPAPDKMTTRLARRAQVIWEELGDCRRSVARVIRTGARSNGPQRVDS